jgi:gamma-glutamyl:cysteine ligase YbdK (ATP-grasp superfamily)
MVLDDGIPRPLRDVARATVRRLRPLARTLGDEDALDGVASMLEENGAAGQRAVFRASGMPALLRDLAGRTGLAESLASA